MLAIGLDVPTGGWHGCPQGEVGYPAAECRPVNVDSTIAGLFWSSSFSSEESAETLTELSASLMAEGVKIRFILGPGASIYSFWLSPSQNGESLGYVGAGTPGFTSNIDTRGLLAYPASR